MNSSYSDGIKLKFVVEYSKDSVIHLDLISFEVQELGLTKYWVNRIGSNYYRIKKFDYYANRLLKKEELYSYRRVKNNWESHLISENRFEISSIESLLRIKSISNGIVQECECRPLTQIVDSTRCTSYLNGFVANVNLIYKKRIGDSLVIIVKEDEELSQFNFLTVRKYKLSPNNLISTHIYIDSDSLIGAYFHSYDTTGNLVMKENHDLENSESYRVFFAYRPLELNNIQNKINQEDRVIYILYKPLADSSRAVQDYSFENLKRLFEMYIEEFE